MGDRTKIRFISDIHLGDSRSFQAPHPYGWISANIPVLAQFLDEQLNAPDLKELVIVGDLFDQWVIPTNFNPLNALDKICSNIANKPVIEKLKALAAKPEIKLTYAPGNHDMGFNPEHILATRQFLDNTFPGIQFISQPTMPLGIYKVGHLAAEHGNRYCLFNAPDPGAAPDDFLPLGYFISRVVAYKVLKTGYDQDPRKIFFNFLKKIFPDPNFVEAVFGAIVEDAGLSSRDKIKMGGIPGYPASITVEDAGERFKDLLKRWEQTPGHVDILNAVWGDLDDLSVAASKVFFESNLNIDIVIFGHTHKPKLDKKPLNPPGDFPVPSSGPFLSIYANTGTWVDKGERGCTYVETEKSTGEGRHYVRLKSYPKNFLMDEGYVMI